MFRFQIGLLVFAILLTACGVTSPAEPTRAPSPLPTRALSPLPTPKQSSAADAAVRAAINDLAAKRKVAADKIKVVSVQDADWPDTSLGCPQPGMFYAQIIVLGYQIVLDVNGQQVNYHADRNGRVVTCQ